MDIQNKTTEELIKELQELQQEHDALKVSYEADINERKQAEEALRTTQFAVDNSPLSIFWISPEGKFTYVNEMAAEKLGYSRKELLSMFVWDVDPNYPEERRKEQWKLYQREKTFRFESELRRRDGTTFPVWVNSFHLAFEGQEIEIAEVEDITERKQAEEVMMIDEEKIRFQSELLRNAPVIAAFHDKDLNMVWANIAYEKAVGSSLKDIAGKKCYSVWKLSGPCQGCPVLTAIATGKSSAAELTPQNQKHWPESQGYWLSKASPVRDKEGSIIGAIEIAIDITERKLAEESLCKSEAKLRELNAQKDRFLSIIAHDLKNPFNSIMGFSNLLEEQVRQKDYQNIYKYARIIRQSSNQAMDLLTNLLEWAQSQTGRIEFSPGHVKLVSFIKETLVLFDDVAREKSITIKQDLPHNLTVFADKSMISTVMRNLISNAVKFTHQGGEVNISAQKTSKEIIVSVKDNGVGIAPNRIEKLFRIDANESTPGTNQEKGTGLGLILCKEFVEKHGGRIWAESVEGKGSAFYFTLPSSAKPE